MSFFDRSYHRRFRLHLRRKGGYTATVGDNSLEIEVSAPCANLCPLFILRDLNLI